MCAAKHWCFTSFEEELQYDEESMVYMVYGREVCPTTGRRHLQGFVSLQKKLRMVAFKTALGDNKAHVEVSRGTIKQASDYCKKDGDFVEFGDKPKEKNVAGGEARKRQYDAAWDAAKTGEFESIESSIKLHCFSNILKINSYYQCRRQIPDLEPGSIVGTWFIGTKGVGKSFNSRAIAKLYGFTLYNKSLNKWWGGYDDQDVVLLEDIDHKTADNMSHHIKTWVDEYPFNAQPKNMEILIRPRHFFVTSNYRINELWPMDLELQEAINRRFTVFHIQSREDWQHLKLENWPENSTLRRYVPKEKVQEPSSSNTESSSCPEGGFPSPSSS